jgi:hypothetical protein
MPDPFYDDVIALALEVPGVWLAESDSGPVWQLRFSSDHPIRQTLPQLAEHFANLRPWRVNDLRYFDERAEGSLFLLSEIDRQCAVHLHEREPRPV